MLFKLNEEKNKGEKLEKVTFSELNMSEVHHLQEIIANNTETLGEKLLIIQKEFHGFDDTNERLDLLALDKNGNLVVIENKLDDSGKDVTWQIIKYASYVSTFTRDEIIRIFQDYLDKKGESESAEELLKEFYEIEDIDDLILNEGNTSQRLILVAGNFRKEITSSVLWLMNYGLNIQCIKATPFRSGDEVLLNMEQIIPVKDLEEFIIKIAEKDKIVEKTKKIRKISVYPIEHHLEGKSRKIIHLFNEIDSYILSKDNDLERIVRKVYIGYKKNNKNVFSIGFPNQTSLRISGMVKHNISKEIEIYKNETQLDISPSYTDSDARNRDYGYPKIEISNESDLNKAKKFIDYLFKNNV